MNEPITRDVRDLAQEVLASGLPPTEHVIDDVLHAIERSVQWRAVYDGLCSRFGKALVNQMIGRWASSIPGWPARADRAQVASHTNTLSESYSVLVPSIRKLSAEEKRVLAGNEVLAFFQTYRPVLDRSALPPHRGELEGRVLQGDPAEEAFLSVMAAHGLDSTSLRAAIADRSGGD
ncbi:hypothetical protein HK414_24295 [Ramlibacter terrae]|uniref:Uncharacterized protein n=1 Tax=Ramlibacter terrae TaxID=2732511 RepID=A0ABX6P7M7_9BURK|nr:hypothetical protein HK414_24295 [Ramlibacter terrae]